MGRLKGEEGVGVFKCFHLDSFNPGRILISGDVYPIPDLGEFEMGDGMGGGGGGGGFETWKGGIV